MQSVLGVVLSAVLGLGLSGVVFASSPNSHGGNSKTGNASGGNNNHGDVWLDGASGFTDPGHEHDPHLGCPPVIYLFASDLADSSGYFTIDGWNGTGSGTGDVKTLTGPSHFASDAASAPGYSQDQAWPGTKAAPSEALWTVRAGTNVVAQINTAQLVAHALSNGDVPQATQGLHFKLQFSMDPQKHKTFWVDCLPVALSHSPTPPPTPKPTPASTPTSTTTPSSTPTTTPKSTPTTTPTSTPIPTSTPTATPLPTSTPQHTPTGGVLGISTGGQPTPGDPASGEVLGASVPATGLGFGLLLALGMILTGLLLTRLKDRKKTV